MIAPVPVHCFSITFVYLIFIFTTTMPFKLIYFYPPDTFMVKVKVTETLIFGRKLEILRIFVNQFSYFGYDYLFLLEICSTVQLY